MIGQLFHRRRAERLARLLEQADGGPRRHSRSPVELTSNGRLVARGELILIDTDLGVRITGVFL